MGRVVHASSKTKAETEAERNTPVPADSRTTLMLSGQGSGSRPGTPSAEGRPRSSQVISLTSTRTLESSPKKDLPIITVRGRAAAGRLRRWQALRWRFDGGVTTAL